VAFSWKKATFARFWRLHVNWKTALYAAGLAYCKDSGCACCLALLKAALDREQAMRRGRDLHPAGGMVGQRSFRTHFHCAGVHCVRIQKRTTFRSGSRQMRDWRQPCSGRAGCC
jgi:hypothetical protein